MMATVAIQIVLMDSLWVFIKFFPASSARANSAQSDRHNSWNLRIPKTHKTLFLFWHPIKDDGYDSRYDRAFDASLWRSGSTKERGYMVESILKTTPLSGKTISEVQEILGKPDSNSINKKDSMKVLYYSIGLQFSFMPPLPMLYPHYLRIIFNAQDRVRAVQTVSLYERVFPQK